MIFVLAAICGSQYASADEGMWMINAIDKALEKNMKQRGLKLSAREIYNADAEHLVKLIDFGSSKGQGDK